MTRPLRGQSRAVPALKPPIGTYGESSAKMMDVYPSNLRPILILRDILIMNA